MNRLALSALLGLLFYLLYFQVKAIWPFTIDDMYIPLRYASHWADGYGLVWNIGELPVEGYSNFSFVVLARVALYYGLDPVYVLKAAGVAGLVLTCIAVYQLTRFWFAVPFALLPCLWLLAFRGQIIWSVSGLETTIYQALVVFSVVSLFRGLGYRFSPELRGKPDIRQIVQAGLLMALAGMTRPEAPALLLLFTVLLWFQDNRLPRTKLMMIYFASFLMVYGGYFFWRWHYFGRLFPNPVYCKGWQDAGSLVLDKQYWRLALPMMVLALPALFKRADSRYGFLLLPGVLYSVLLIGASPLVAFDNRLFLPAYVLLLPLALLGIYTLLTRFPKTQDMALYLVSGLVIVFFIPMMSLSGYRYFTQNPVAGEHLRENVLAWLEGNTRASSRVVLADSGMIPWRINRHFTDSYCLNNSAMTLDKPKDMYRHFCQQVFRTHPDVIVLTALIEHGKVIYTPADACMADRLKADKTWQLQASMNTGNRNGYYRYEIWQSLGNV